MVIYEHGSRSAAFARLVKRLCVIFGPHLTPTRLFNLLRMEFAKARRHTTVPGRPYVLFTEVSSICNLRCPGCLSHTGEYHAELMELDDFKRILDHYARWLIDLELYGWGEPFLNRNIFEMIAYAKAKNLFVRTSSNFNKLQPGDHERIVESGLDQINASLDGVTQETYEQYRVGASLEVALDNLRKLVAAKRKLGSKHPLIEWQFIVSKVNYKELGAVRKLAAEVGVDILRLDLPFSLVHINQADDPTAKERWLADDPTYRQWEEANKGDSAAFKRPCCYLWNTLQIDATGQVNPCPNRRGSVVQCGGATAADPRDIWNQPFFVQSRELFVKTPDSLPQLTGPCPACGEAAQPWRHMWPDEAQKLRESAAKTG